MKTLKLIIIILAVVPLYAASDSTDYSCEHIQINYTSFPDSFYIGTPPNPFSPVQHEFFGIPVICLVRFIFMDINYDVIIETQYCILNKGHYRFLWGDLINWQAFRSGIYYLKLIAKSSEGDKILYDGEKKIVVVK